VNGVEVGSYDQFVWENVCVEYGVALSLVVAMMYCVFARVTFLCAAESVQD